MSPSMIQTRSGRLAEMSRELEEIRQLNKKNHRQERQMKEEEEKRKKDAEVPKSRSNETAMAAEVTAASQEGIEDEDALNFTVNVHKIMNGVEEMETDKQDEEQEDERSPMKKCPGSSKASSRRGRTVRQVSPADSGSATTLKPAIRTTPIIDTFNHKYKRTVVKLAILLTSKKKFEEFTQSLMAFLTNAQMVDPKFVINPLNPQSKSKDIAMKGDISPNMTKLGEHIKISRNGPNVFNKRKVWDKDDGHKSRKANKKEEFQNPTVYFSMFVSSETPPRTLSTARHTSRPA